MKKLILSVALTFLFIAAFSQQVVSVQKIAKSDLTYQELDEATIRCTYRFAQPLTMDKQSSQAVDTMTLDIGAKASKYCDDLRMRRDSLFSDFMSNGINPSSITSISVMKDVDDMSALGNGSGTTMQNSFRGETGQLFKNRKTNEIIIIDKGDMNSHRYKCVEKLTPQQWNVTADTLTVLGYVCQKATTTFRGRTYDAWFTPDIPANDGPWKFYGLPGLILKVADSENLFSFELIGLEQLNPAAKIRIPEYEYISCNRKELAKLKAKQSGGMGVNMNGGNMIIVNMKNKNEYQQLEKE